MLNSWQINSGIWVESDCLRSLSSILPLGLLIQPQCFYHLLSLLSYGSKLHSVTFLITHFSCTLRIPNVGKPSFSTSSWSFHSHVPITSPNWRKLTRRSSWDSLTWNCVQRTHLRPLSLSLSWHMIRGKRMSQRLFLLLLHKLRRPEDNTLSPLTTSNGRPEQKWWTSWVSGGRVNKMCQRSWDLSQCPSFIWNVVCNKIPSLQVNSTFCEYIIVLECQDVYADVQSVHLKFILTRGSLFQEPEHLAQNIHKSPQGT